MHINLPIRNEDLKTSVKYIWSEIKKFCKYNFWLFKFYICSLWNAAWFPRVNDCFRRQTNRMVWKLKVCNYMCKFKTKIWDILGDILSTFEFVYKFGVYNVLFYGRQIFYQNLRQWMSCPKFSSIWWFSTTSLSKMNEHTIQLMLVLYI